MTVQEDQSGEDTKDIMNGSDNDAAEDDSEDGEDMDNDEIGNRPTGEDDKNEKTLYIVDENTNYSLFSNPPSLRSMRQRLFDVIEPIEMSSSDFQQYFPFIDNVWRRNRAGEPQKDENITTETYWCRLKTSGSQKLNMSKPPQEGKQQRRKRKREEKTCPMAIKIVTSTSPSGTCTISRMVAPEVRHSHDLDYMDQNKRNSGVMDIARKEATKGFLPGSVYWKMQEEPDKMDEAGGRYMKVSDVRNVQYPWRQLNTTTVLKAHAGYNQQRSGPRAKPLATSTKIQPIFQTSQSSPLQPTNPYNRPLHPSPLQPYPPPLQSTQAPLPTGTLQYPDHAREFLHPFLPQPGMIAARNRPHVTLTWATSLDSRIALMPGVQTAISGPETKAMTHFLRSTHDAIVVGVKTAIADDPGLNCRLAGVGGYGGQRLDHQPRPVIIDPHARLPIRPEMRLLRAVSEGRALGPWVVVGPQAKLNPNAVSILKSFGGEFLMVNEISQKQGLNWESLFEILHNEGIKSVMIEGGGQVLSDLLRPSYARCIDSVIITIAPTFFGKTGVQVSPDPTYNDHGQPIATRLLNVRWQPMGDSDVVMCGQMSMPPAPMLPGIHEIVQPRPQAPGPSSLQQQQQSHYHSQQQLPPPSAIASLSIPSKPPPHSMPHENLGVEGSSKEQQHQRHMNGTSSPSHHKKTKT